MINTIIMKVLQKVRSLMSAVVIAFLMVLFTPAVYAQAVHTSSDFNHMKTGFPLTGVHISVDCETCHVGGVFKGTPTDCAGCHTIGRRIVATSKPSTHLITTAQCNTCHNNTVTFLGARFNHFGVMPNQCSTCHNGLTAPAKKAGHIGTILSCDKCHRTSTWLPAGFDHTSVFEPCANCHNCSTATCKPPTHIPTTAPCDSCHKTGFTSFTGAVYDHVGQTACETCHITGQYGAKTRPAGHIPTGSLRCDNCHVGTGFISFAGSTMNHSVVEAVPIACSTCHNGSYTTQGSFLGGAKAKNSGHVVTTAECGTCHLGRSSFLGGLFVHATATPAVAGRCRTCHNGVSALGPTNSVTHTTSPGNTASCDTCHGTANSYTSFAGAAFSHTGVVAGTCGTCHLGQTGAVTKGSTHIPTSGNGCDSCHVSGYAVGAFLTSTMNHSAVTAYTCATCHNGSYISEKGSLGLGALAKTPTHISTSSSCDSCHHSFTTFLGAVFNHSGVTPTTCGSCHLTGLGGALMKPVNHIPTTSNACDACHKNGYTTFAGGLINHAAVTIYRCDNCHTNASYLGSPKLKPANHIPTTITGALDCNTCHSSTTSFLTEKMNHNATTTGCKTCHNNGTSYLGNMTKMTLGSHQGSSAGDDCSKSGCHRPLGNIGSSWVKWN